MISQEDLQRRLLAASGVVPPQQKVTFPGPMPPPRPESQYQKMLNLAGDPNVPEAIRTSATDQANKHAALARKAQSDPHTYQSGGEVAEEQGMAERSRSGHPEAGKPNLGDVFSQGADVAEGMVDPRKAAVAAANTTGSELGGMARGALEGLGGFMTAARPAVMDALGMNAGAAGIEGAPPPGPAPMPGHDAVPLPGVYGPQGPPGMPNPRLPGSPAMPPPTGGRSAWEHKSDQTFPIDPGVRPQTPASKTWEWLKQHPPDSWGLPKPEDNTTGGIVPPPGGFEKPPESPNHVGDANPSNPSSGNNGALYPGAPGIPVSKPTNIPAGPARKKKPPGTPPGQWKNNDGAPGPGVVGTVTRPGIEAAGPPHQLFPQGNSSAGAGGSAAPDAGQTPTFSKAAENAVKPLEAPKPVNPLAWALIKGGAALMQSQHQFGQALGEGISAGAEGYMEAQNVDFENLRKVNDDARAQQREARETYRDTQLATFIAKENAAQAKRLNEIRTTDSDRTFNLGERKLGLEGTQEAHAYELGKGGLGVQQSNAATARGQLGVAQGQLDVAREELTPSAVREVESYMQQYIRLHPETPNTPEGNQKAYDEAWKAYQKAHPQSNNYFGGLDSLTGQPAQIPDGTVSGAVPP